MSHPGQRGPRAPAGEKIGTLGRRAAYLFASHCAPVPAALRRATFAAPAAGALSRAAPSRRRRPPIRRRRWDPAMACLYPAALLSLLAPYLPSLPSLPSLPYLAPPPAAKTHRTRLLLPLHPALLLRLTAHAEAHHGGRTSAAVRALLDAAPPPPAGGRRPQTPLDADPARCVALPVALAPRHVALAPPDGLAARLDAALAQRR